MQRRCFVSKESDTTETDGLPMHRRKVLKLATATIAAMVAPVSGAIKAASKLPPTQKENTMTQKAFVYTELQISAPFGDIPWHDLNMKIKKQPGFINKTWLYGVGNNSTGGLYAFDSIENAQKFVTGYFPEEAGGFGVAQTTRVFDADASAAASRDMNSMHYDGKLDRQPGAFVYTEIQLHSMPFDSTAPWRELNPILKKQPGLLAKTWLSGIHTGTPGGFYAFDTIENAKKFALEYFPTEAKALNAAFYTRVFDSATTEAAGREMNSPFYI
jgi:hypothetical protein